ncbi:DUF4249 family protein [Lewinella sp. IMCC34183]|uniref:DUF4249 family protein n=1 Tax=Lewinella sp. IMCC34183 TaxID=2248762 RepID=UPI000E27963F|nr:DUF4249 family protein [Lewinella sp. IMCC34183]
MSPALFDLRCTRVPALLLLAFLLFGCVDEIDLKQADDLPEGIVLRGRLLVTADDANVEINLERLFQFSSNLPERVVTARVTLENSEGQKLALPYRDGAYRSPIGLNNPDMAIRPGLGYRVLIEEGADEAYASEFDVLQEALTPTELTYSFVDVDGLTPAGTPVVIPSVQYELSTPTSNADGSPAQLRYEIEVDFALTDSRSESGQPSFISTTCYVNQLRANNQVLLLDGRDVAGGSVAGYPLLTVPKNFAYAEGNYTTANQLAISREAFTYFEQIEQIADQEESIFGSPPGPVVGNVIDVNGNTSNVFGFFYTANTRPARVGISRAEADSPNYYCPLPQSMNPPPPPTVCDDCLRYFGASLDQPTFWAY